MRELIVTENITLDGVVEATDNWFGPTGSPSEVDQSDHEQAIREQREAADVFLVGRVTYEQMRGYWPQQTDDTTGISDYLRLPRQGSQVRRLHHAGATRSGSRRRCCAAPSTRRSGR
jgi:hypothetical protein